MKAERTPEQSFEILPEEINKFFESAPKYEQGESLRVTCSRAMVQWSYHADKIAEALRKKRELEFLQGPPKLATDAAEKYESEFKEFIETTRPGDCKVIAQCDDTKQQIKELKKQRAEEHKANFEANKAAEEVKKAEVAEKEEKAKEAEEETKKAEEEAKKAVEQATASD